MILQMWETNSLLIKHVSCLKKKRKLKIKIVFNIWKKELLRSILLYMWKELYLQCIFTVLLICGLYMVSLFCTVPMLFHEWKHWQHWSLMFVYRGGLHWCRSLQAANAIDLPFPNASSGQLSLKKPSILIAAVGNCISRCFWSLIFSFYWVIHFHDLTNIGQHKQGQHHGDIISPEGFKELKN